MKLILFCPSFMSGFHDSVLLNHVMVANTQTFGKKATSEEESNDCVGH